MRRLFRRVLQGIAALGACLALAVPAWSGDNLAGMISGPAWPHTGSDIRPDPDARFGRLGNGMRYILYRNTAEGRTTSMRFLMATGSLQERDDQRGMAVAPAR